MATEATYELTSSGQILKVTKTSAVVTNPAAVIKMLSQIDQEATPAVAAAKNTTQCFYNLGEGVSAFIQEDGDTMRYYGVVHCPELFFYTDWTLKQDPKVNGGKHFITPNVNEEGSDKFNVGAPLRWPVPDNLIIHFTVAFTGNSRDSHAFNPVQPIAEHLVEYPSHITNMRRANYYLTCFNTDRNTCVNLPLPNHYDDCHLCVGNAFSMDAFTAPHKHDGFVTSMLSFKKAWAATSWNLHIMDNPTDYKCQSYQKLIRFDAATGIAIPPEGLEYWQIAGCPIPIEDIYRPFIRPDVKAVVPAKYPGARPRVQNF